MTLTRTQVHPSELMAALAAGTAPRVLDVRTPAEFETVHIPGSYNVPLDTLREHREELGSHLEDEVVLVCRSGNRAEQAERLLGDVGLPQVRVLVGGMQAWERDNGPVRRGAGRWDIERQVRLVAGSIVATSVLVSAVVPKAKWVAGGVGAGLTFAALTDTCAMGMALAKLPYNRGATCDLDSIVSQLAADRPTIKAA